MALSKERMGEIALALCKDRMMQKPVHLGPRILNRELGNVSKRIGVPSHELMQFTGILMKEVVNKVFDCWVD